jgi:release factor glutamine methyltransferase
MPSSIISCVNSISKKIASLYQSKEQQEQIAWWFIEFVTGVNRTLLIAHPQRTISEQEQKKLDDLVAQHIVEHKPLQYIFGSVIFADLTLIVPPPIHIPRPETEEWTMYMIGQFEKLKNKSISLLDMCTGSGCIGLACAYHIPDANVVAVDSSDAALTCARANAQHNSITNITWYKTDLFAGIPRELRFDCIMSNPPYVSNAEWQQLAPDVRLWEDPNALVARDDGYALILAIIDQAPDWIIHNQQMKEFAIPQLVIEMSDHQTDTVAAYAQNNGWNSVAIHKDYAGLKRIVTARIT